jgi:hypothetical protein
MEFGVMPSISLLLLQVKVITECPANCVEAAADSVPPADNLLQLVAGIPPFNPVLAVIKF